MSYPFRTVVAAACFLLAVAFAASPFFSNGFGGFDPSQFPVPQNDPPVQPAGWAFAIWGPIYLWLIVGLGYGLWRAPRDGQWHAMRLPLCLSLAVGTGWIAVAMLSPVWASVMIWVMLIAALAALFASPVEEAPFAALPVGFYAGWLSAASCVSLGLLAAGYGWLEEATAAFLFVGMAIVIGALVQATLKRAPTYGIAVIWALTAVAMADWSTVRGVSYLAIAGAAVVLIPTLRALRPR